MDDFSAVSLLPRFASVASADAELLHRINGLFGGLLLAVLVWAVLYALWKWLGARSRVRFILNMLGDLEPDGLLKARENLKNLAKEGPKKGGDIWLEYDEAIVPAGEPSQLYNTYDASHFFNPRSLAQGLVGNRLLASIPGVLTAIGVLGTFLGLTMGLSGINLATDASIENIRSSIGTMISSANVAFLTSVWGVLLSVIFNVFEKALEGSASKKVRKLQHRIDRLFPRLTAETKLVDIEDHERESRKTLQGLAEQIGNKMQEALIENSRIIADQLNTSLDQALKPAISQLVDNANQGSEKAIESLLERFLERMGDVGNSQRKLLDQASADFSSSAAQVSGEFTTILQSIESMQSEQNQVQSRLLETSEESARQLGSEFQTTVGALASEVSKVGAYQAELGRAVEAASAASSESSSALVTDVRSMSLELGAVAETNKTIGQELVGASTALKDAAAEMRSFAGTIQQTTDALRSDLVQATATTKSLATQNHSFSQQLSAMLDTVRDTQSQTSDATSLLREITSDASGGMKELKQHLMEYQQGLNSHLSELEKQVAGLLDDYGQRVQGQTHERLNQWNEQTTEFTGLMKDSIQALSDVVDDIQARVG